MKSVPEKDITDWNVDNKLEGCVRSKGSPESATN